MNPPSLNLFKEDFGDNESFYSLDLQLTSQHPPPLPPPRLSQMKIFRADAHCPSGVVYGGGGAAEVVTSQSERFCHPGQGLAEEIGDPSGSGTALHCAQGGPPGEPSHDGFPEGIELLLLVETLGGRKPLELLADMLELYRPSQHNNIFFAALFLQGLPRKMRVLLTHEDHIDLRGHPHRLPGRFLWWPAAHCRDESDWLTVALF